jgi:PKD repeat protein
MTRFVGRGRHRHPIVFGLLCALIALLIPLGTAAGPTAGAASAATALAPTCSISVNTAPPGTDPGSCSVGAAFQSNLGTTYPISVTNTPITNATWTTGGTAYSVGAFGSANVDMTAPILIDPHDCMTKYGFVAINNGAAITTTNPGPYACTLDVAGGSGTTVIKWTDDSTNFGFCTWFPPDVDKVCDNSGPEFDIAINWSPVTAPPTAAFTATQADPANTPGKYQFTDDSTDSDGGALTESWTFGDGQTATGVSVLHTYTKPGQYTATLKVTDSASGLSSTTTKAITVAAPKLQVALDFVDANGTVLPTVTPLVGDTVNVRLTLSASSDGVGSISKIAAVGPALSATPDAAVTIGSPTPAVPASLTLAGGNSVSYVFPVKVVAAGVVKFSAAFNGVDDSGATVTGSPAQLSFGVSSLKVTLSANPSSFTLEETAAGPTPKTITISGTVTNLTNQQLTNVNLISFGPSRSTTGQLLNVAQINGPAPDPNTGWDLHNLAPAASVSFTADFLVGSDGKIAFNGLVTAASPDGSTLRGFGSTTLNVAPQYWLELTSHVQSPNGGTLPAGSPIVISGSVHNVSDSASEDVGPLFAQAIGNAGLEGLSYNGVGVDPKTLSEPGALTLDPGDTKDFTLKVLTAYSDPEGNGGVRRSGGTSATITFTPWATVTEQDGTTFTTTPADILSTDDDLSHRISIDDSIALPASADPVAEPAAVAGGLLAGGAEGIWDAASGVVGGLASGLMSLPTAPGSALLAVTQYQQEVWDSFTNAQKEAFGQDCASAIVPVLEANAGLAAEGSATLFNKASAFALQYFTKLDNDWHVGNYAQTVEDYTSLATSAIGQVAIPEIIGKTITSTVAAAAVDAKQASNVADTAELTSGLTNAEAISEPIPSLTKIADGTPLTPSLIQKLYGIAANELAALQKLADENQFLLIVRSRAESSLDWLQNFAAMVKPEALKIKSVSQLDVSLGYPISSSGSLIFKEPQPYIEWIAAKEKGDYANYVTEFVQSKGFSPGSPDYANAIARVNERTKEWLDWSKQYKAWSKRGWIDVSFNWKGNAMEDPTVSGSGKYAGFRLQPTGVEGEYEVQMYNQKVGKYVPVTGDIDPIAFTHVDGSPLTADEHAKLVNQMRLDPNLQSQHGESATYVNGGIGFIQKQFKPNEAALMIAPGDTAPRAVRLNPNETTWTSATNYKLVWDGQFIDAGSEPAVGPQTVPVEQPTRPVAVLPEPVQPIPGDGTTAEPNVGRCAFVYSTTTGTPALEMSPSGAIVQISGSAFISSPLEQSCFSPGPVITVRTQPSTLTSAAIPAGTSEVPVQTGAPYASDNSQSGFAVGDTVSIDAGSSDAETGTVDGFGSIIFSKPLHYGHPAGTVLTVTGEAGTTVPLADTGTTDLADEIEIGVALLLTGGFALQADHRRKRPRLVRQA